MSKLKVFFHTDFTCAKTGFATNARRIISYLYKTGKYDIVHYCCNMRNGDMNLDKTPWLSIGCLPQDETEFHQMVGPENSAQSKVANYGHFMLEVALKEHKPDVYIGQQDFWAFDGYTKEWWNKFPCVIHTTIDSLPVLDIATENADKIKNFWVWSEFAEKEMHSLGIKHIKTVHGSLDEKDFFKLSDKQRSNLRGLFSINEDDFIIGFVFRNQLRKSIPQLLEAFKIFKEKTGAKAKLLLHTCFSETVENTWDIPKLIKDIGVDNEDVLVSHVCHTCHKYLVKPFVGEGDICPFCGSKGEDGLHTPNVMQGLDTDELNDVYNLMDVYCHPFTSGGQEIPIQEAKLTELITLVTKYSCGEDLCSPEAKSVPLKWTKDWEVQTNFIKARTNINSIVDGLISVYEMDKNQRDYEGKEARNWVIENYSINVIGKQFEDFLDKQEKASYDFSMKPLRKNPEAVILPISNNKEWLKQLYKNILKLEVTDNDTGLLDWLSNISAGMSRDRIEEYFRNEAMKENHKIDQQESKTTLREIIGFSDEKKLLFVIPESIGDVFMATSLLKGIKEKYPEHKLIVATSPQYFTILKGNQYVDKTIQYLPEFMDSELLMTGQGKQKGFVDVYIHATVFLQRFLNYITK